MSNPSLRRHIRTFQLAGVAIILSGAVLLFVSDGSRAAPGIRQGTTVTYGVLAGSTITNTGPTIISGTAGGDVGLSPGTSYTGSGSVTRTGTDHITDAAAATAQADLVTAYDDLGVPAPTVLGAPDLAGQVIIPGTYSTAAGTFSNSGTLTLDAGGDPAGVFIFQADSTVITSSLSTMSLINGAQACNVFWRVGSSATIGVSSTFIGQIYALTSITAQTSATINGQLLARNGAVTLDTNTIVNDSCVAAVTTSVATTVVPTTTIAAVSTTVASGVTTVVPTTTTTISPGSTTVPPTTTMVPIVLSPLPATGDNNFALAFAAVVVLVTGNMLLLRKRKTARG